MAENLGRKYILDTGEVKALEDGSDQMLISGWASTKDLDLAGDIVLPSAFTKHWDFYATKGRYWFQHNPNEVIGKVLKARLTSEGFYIDQAKLADIAFNRDWLWPLVKEGALNEHSIQFMSIDPEMKGGILYHKEIKMIETSIVSVACNPGAVITGFKSLVPSEEYYEATLPQIMDLRDQGLLLNPSEVRRNFYISGLKNDQDTKDMNEPVVQTPAVDLADIKVLPRDMSRHDPKGAVLDGFKLPSPKAKNYHTVCDELFLAKSSVRGKHMFRVANPTAKGWAYDWPSVAITMGTVLGAKGAAQYAAGEKTALVRELLSIYKTLGKAAPMNEGESLDNLNDEAIEELKYHEVAFANGEDEVLRQELVKGNVKSLCDALGYWVKNGGVPESVQAYVKSVYPSLSFCFSVYPDDQDDLDFINAIMAVLTSYLTEEATDAEDAGMFYAMSLDGLDEEAKAKVRLARFAKSIVDEADPEVFALADEKETAKAEEADETEAEEKALKEETISKSLADFLADDPDNELLG